MSDELEAIYKRHYEGEPDWAANEEQLYTASRDRIERFAQDHPNEICSAFGFDSDPDYGYVLFAFDTPENQLKQAVERNRRNEERLHKSISGEEAWKRANYRVPKSQACLWAPSTGYFAYLYNDKGDEVRFERWEEFTYLDDAELPDRSNPDYERLESKVMAERHDYHYGHAILIFWRVLGRLVNDGVFTKLNQASPFRLCYNLHDEPLVIVRLLNWPLPS